MASFTAEKLIADTRRRSMLPNATGLGSSDTDILAYLNDALQMYIAPLLIRVGGEYLVTIEDLPVTPTTEKYVIPSRSLGNKLRDVMLYRGTRYVSLQQVEPEQLREYPVTGMPTAFYIENGNIVLVPSPDSTYTLRVKYYRRPNELVMSDEATLISGSTVVGSTTTIAVPTGTGSQYAGQRVDIIKGTSPFINIVSNVVPTATTSNTVSFNTSDVVSAPASGDWLCLADTSPVAQIPQELHPLLAQTAALEMAEALNNPRAGEVLKKREIMKNQALPLITPRSEGTGRVIINKNGPGFKYWRFRYWR